LTSLCPFIGNRCNFFTYKLHVVAKENEELQEQRDQLFLGVNSTNIAGEKALAVESTS